VLKGEDSQRMMKSSCLSGSEKGEERAMGGRLKKGHQCGGDVPEGETIQAWGANCGMVFGGG